MAYRAPNVPAEALNILGLETGSILDVGGGVAPYYRATNVMDRRPFDAEKMRESAWGGASPVWTEAAYTRWDITRAPWPLRDQQFDLALCSMTLEDIPDPFTVLREMARVAKHTLIVVPTRLVEHVQGVEHPRACGYAHHCWMVTPVAPNKLIFRRKTSTLLVPGCHITCPIGMQLNPIYESAYAYAPAFETEQVGYWDSFQDIDEHRGFVNSLQTQGLWIPSEEPLTLRARLWVLKTRYWS